MTLVVAASTPATSSSGSSGSRRAAACLGSGIAVITFSNPFYSALALIGNLASLAVLYLLLSAEFVAAAQVLVYAGAVMVMFLFVIAYLGGECRRALGRTERADASAAIAAAVALLVEVLVAIGLTAGGRPLARGEDLGRRSAARRRSAACS